MINLFPPKINIKDPSTHQIGRIGEILTAYYLELYGVQTEIVRTHGCDLWCATEDGNMFTCEVKTCQSPYMQTGHCREGSYRFHINSEVQRKADIHALVGLDIMGVRFVLTEDLPPGAKKMLKARHLTEEMIFCSLEDTLNRLFKKKKAA